MSRIIANNIRHNDATVDSLSFDSSARVGIGEASPNRQLVVNGGTSEGVIQITNDTSGTAVANGFELIHFTNGETQLLNRENGAMRFDTNGTERMRLLSTGGLTFNGDTAAANALDDYEEGTWTPTLSDQNGNAATLTVQQGFYTKTGNIVNVWWQLHWSGKGSMVSSYYLLLGGFPFTSKYNSSQYYYTGALIQSASTIGVLAMAGNGVSAVIIPPTSGGAQLVSSLNGSGYINCSLTYFT